MSLIARRNWALRLSIVLNVCVLLYVCAHFTSSGPWIEEAPSNWGAANAVALADTYGSSSENIQVNASQRSRESGSSSSQYNPKSTKETNQLKDKRVEEKHQQQQHTNQEIDSLTGRDDRKLQPSAKITDNTGKNANEKNAQELPRANNDNKANKTVK